MSPELIICDEFGGEEDIRSAIFAIKSGAKIAASAHAFDKKDFSDKPFTKKIIEHKLFSYFVFMDKNFEIKEIVSAEELLL
jgi:stage III sporulation protein AA